MRIDTTPKLFTLAALRSGEEDGWTYTVSAQPEGEMFYVTVTDEIGMNNKDALLLIRSLDDKFSKSLCKQYDNRGSLSTEQNVCLHHGLE